MHHRQKEKWLDITSKISRTAAVTLGLGLVLASFSMIGVQKMNLDESYRQVNYSANIAQMVGNQGSARILRQNIIKGYGVALENHFKKVPGSKEFLADLKEFKTIESLQVKTMSSGIVVSLMATNGESDVLHPYYGFFVSRDGEIVRIIWGGLSTGKVTAMQDIKEQEMMSVTVINTGEYPWLQSDEWRNNGRDEVIHLAPQGQSVTNTGEKGIFLIPLTDTFSLQNITRGFPVLLEQ
jgi:hypothetical protein